MHLGGSQRDIAAGGIDRLVHRQVEFVAGDEAARDGVDSLRSLLFGDRKPPSRYLGPVADVKSNDDDFARPKIRAGNTEERRPPVRVGTVQRRIEFYALIENGSEIEADPVGGPGPHNALACRNRRREIIDRRQGV